MTDSVPALEARRLWAAYHQQPVLEDISLSLPQGQWTAIVGPNGAGKSSLLNLMIGSLAPLRGELKILGQSAASQRRAGSIAYMAQQERMEWDFPISVRDTVLTGRYGLMRHDSLWQRLLPRQWANPSHRQAVEAALEAVDMADHAARPIGELSGGQKKRVMLARALAQQARILLLDEPLAGVDPPSETLILNTLERERSIGRTIIMVTHDMPSARLYADNVLLINRTLVGMGTPDEMLSDAMLARLAVGAREALPGGERVAA
ncbi:metal ABC transporter ATP-binding protein [Billgrantia tianxiuensis]|jgi:manganese/iron transport system ATP-binding protein|uniref:Metal ABC transporter ATP-binding protein n=1 Tax=Billgrantia tianxiuensis TaxID=2497861 RepID=A0A6I6SGR4_9GAMM|nr:MULTISPECIES: metal ABC transporter ATP-binding protein [Halomonas]MCE8034871.1 metal ABC transporter ATP-binding protein [Halomonas sp. MCCC 1A11057]QHC48591.1 metal ABC transporter ATP-binding protein [Halomonas tianxiuensis]